MPFESVLFLWIQMFSAEGGFTESFVPLPLRLCDSGEKGAGGMRGLTTRPKHLTR